MTQTLFKTINVLCPSHIYEIFIAIEKQILPLLLLNNLMNVNINICYN